MEGLKEDIRHGLRMLWKHPFATVSSVASLAVGIGVNSTLFSVVNSLYLKPLPVKDPDRLVTLYSFDPAKVAYRSVSYQDYLDYRESGGIFSNLAAYLRVSLDFASSAPGGRKPVAARQCPAAVDCRVGGHAARA
jgi:putative ABC transport system permease protein